MSALTMWSPRILALMMVAFVSLLAFDTFSEERAFGQALFAFVIHLAPAVVIVAIVVVAWRWEWIGAVAFLGLAGAYATVARDRLDWMVIISGPLAMIGLLYAWTWWKHDASHGRH
jgi:hypothetical protein